MSEAFLIRDRRGEIIDLRYDEQNAKSDMARRDPDGKLKLHIQRICGQDYMAGQVCMRTPDHEGDHD